MKTLSNNVFGPIVFAIIIITGIVQTTSPTYADAITDLLGTTPKTSEEAPVTKVITTDDTRSSDKKIRKRLGEIYDELEDLNKLNVSVNKGVVTLNGEVNSSAIQEKAASLAKKVEGVVEVENEIIVTRNIEKRLDATWGKLLNLGKQLLTNLPLFIIALVVFILFWLLGGWISNRKGLFRRLSSNAFIADLFGQIVHIVFIIIGLVVALSLLDATALLGTIMGAAGIFGLAIGFAVRDTVENYIASVLLSLRNPFQVNDYVDVDGNEGSVARLTSRATILITADGNHLRIPNSKVYKAIITNFTRNNERRFSFDLGIDAAQDLSEAQQLAMETLLAIEGVLADPKPSALVQELGDSNVILRVNGWVDQDQYSFSKVRSEAIKKAKQAFDDAGVIMPEPIYQIRMSENNQVATSNNDVKAKAEVKSKPKESTQKKSKVTEPSADIQPDDTMKDQIQEEHAENGNENLLNSNALSE